MKLLKIAVFSLLAIPVVSSYSVSAQTTTNPCANLSGSALQACENKNPKPSCTTVYKPNPTACKGVPYPYYDACMRTAPLVPVQVCK